MDLRYEKKFWKQYDFVLGVDEVGRGPLAGPVTAAAVFISPEIEIGDLREVNDSKRLSPKKRERLFNILIQKEKLTYSVSSVFPQKIDMINIREATRLAMYRSVQKILHKKKIDSSRTILLIDGNVPLKTKISQRCIIRGDQKVFSCAAASIIAKVLRDKKMERYDYLFPLYGFKKHKGYCTKEHRLAIEKYGPTRIHRFSFSPLKDIRHLPICAKEDTMQQNC